MTKRRWKGSGQAALTLRLPGLVLPLAGIRRADRLCPRLDGLAFQLFL